MPEHWVIPFSAKLETVAYLSAALPLAVAWRRRHLLSPPLQVLFWIPVYILIASGIAWYLSHKYYYNLPFIHLTTVVETLLYILVYYRALAAPRTRYYIKLATVGFLVFAAFDSFYLEGMQQINSYTNALETFIIISLALLYFEQTLHDLSAARLERDPLFLASVGIVLYLTGTVTIYLLMARTVTDEDELTYSAMSIITSLLLLLLCGMLTWSFLMAGRANTQHKMPSHFR
ncbi:hypothetical protein LJY25_17135 [Hymenobacter sp. BT175]|uniref:hypothetical protein n=1 Tax=Hymenobacter translucens TaxID=2886507 RepID=UPI001D0E889C|nr:hypothetical protein [Hymenobacter translucens]MCC2548177.1 hypothetical protein [Hymenobacter translucens]